MANEVTISLYDQLNNFFNSKPGRDNNALSRLRKDAFEVFRKNGFPSVKEEDWRFTNLGPFLNDSFRVETHLHAEEKEQKNSKSLNGLNGNGHTTKDILPGQTVPGLADFILTQLVPGLDSYRLVLVNGVLRTDLSVLPPPQLVTVRPLQEVAPSETFLEHHGDIDHVGGRSLVALNTALFEDGFYIEVKPECEIYKPIQILHIYTVNGNMLFNPRHLLIVNAHAKVEIIEKSVGIKQDGSILFANSVLTTVVKEHARLTHYRLQQNEKNERWLLFNQVFQGRDSRYDNFTFSLPEAELIRNNLEVTLEGPATETHLNGLYLVAEGQLTDNHTSIEHMHPGCQSNELYKGVITGNGKAVFNGKVFVDPDAQQTNAFQQNNNLLLSDKAQVHAKPQLEIFADDVKCSHGCTIGQFNPESLFYLRSRGIGEEAARNLLVQAFAYDVTEKIENLALKEYTQKIIYQKMTS